MLNFAYHLPVNLIFGAGAADLAGEQAALRGKRALLVTGGSSARRSGLYDRVTESLEKAGVGVVPFGRVEQNPLTTTAEAGADAAKRSGCDVVVGLGGGSVMDCAKAIAFLALNDGDISEYIYGRLTGDRALPLILIPTTCGTGSEGNGFAVLTNPATGDKKSLRTPAVIAKASLIDPACMTTLPGKVLASVGFDALCHSMEAYTSNAATPLSDSLALTAMELAAGSLVPLVTGEDGSMEAWEKLTLASTLGGMAIGTAGCTLAHGMEHPASGIRNIVHGQGLAALTPAAIEALLPGRPERFARISALLGGTGAGDCADAVRELLARIGLSVTLGDLGIRGEDIPWMTENCLKVSAGNLANCPVPADAAVIEDIYRRCL